MQIRMQIPMQFPMQFPVQIPITCCKPTVSHLQKLNFIIEHVENLSNVPLKNGRISGFWGGLGHLDLLTDPDGLDPPKTAYSTVFQRENLITFIVAMLSHVVAIDRFQKK